MSLFPEQVEMEGLLVDRDSVTWRYSSDARLYAAMLYPLLLQVAHPTVGAGVKDFSDFERRPWDRLLRTIDYVTLLVYGGVDAGPAGRRLRELHKSFRGVKRDGSRYSALEPEAYAWVHATLIDTYVRGHAHFGRPMSMGQVEAFYREYRGLGRLIGIRERDLPRRWTAFRHYFNDMVENELVRTESTDRVLRAVRHAPPPALGMPPIAWRAARVPASRALWLGGVGLVPGDLRRRLGIRWTPFDQAAFWAMGTASRGCDPLLPGWLKVTGPAHLRWRSEAIAAGPLGERPAVAAA